MKRFWTPEKQDKLRREYAERNTHELAAEFGVTYHAVKTYAQKIGLKKGTKKPFTENEIETLKAHYYNTPWIELLALMPGRDKECIYSKACAIGLSRLNASLFEKGKRRSPGTEFKPGNTSYNKGRKQAEYMSAEAIERTKATRFKKGNLPHNTRHDLDITIRTDKRKVPNYHIRVSLSKWEYLTRWLWMQEHGPIPKGHCVIVKDGNTMNCVPKNLELITRKENVLRNSIHRYRESDPELYKTIYSLIALKSTITKHLKKIHTHG